VSLFGKSYEARALERQARAFEQIAHEFKRFNDRHNLPRQFVSVTSSNKEEFFYMGTKKVHVLVPKLLVAGLPDPLDIAGREVQVEQFDGSVLVFGVDGTADGIIDEAGKWEPGKEYAVTALTIDKQGNRGPETTLLLKLNDTTNNVRVEGMTAAFVREEFVDVEVPEEPTVPTEPPVEPPVSEPTTPADPEDSTSEPENPSSSNEV
jgi:hypothetical protein